MSTARGLANHSLYMARLMTDAWGQTLSRAAVNPGAVDAAFAPAVRLHLLDAYGWFLLAMLRHSPLPERPPHKVAELPTRGAGVAEPGEISEYGRLEASGWLARLQATLPSGIPARPRGDLLVSVGNYPQIGDYEEWIDAFTVLFDRMSDSLDEY